MTIIKKFTPEEAVAYLKKAREDQEKHPKEWVIRYGQQLINNLRNDAKQLDPVPTIFYTTDDQKVDEWFWETWVQTE